MAEADSEKYRQFVFEQVKTLGSLDFDFEIILWHYTTGDALIGIVESGTLFSTQVSCVNDSSEIRYAQSLFRQALTDTLSAYKGDERVKQFLTKYLKLMEEDPQVPSHAPSQFFIACFSAETDSLSQWRAYCNGVNGYAIGFKPAALVGSPLMRYLTETFWKARSTYFSSRVA
jgi:hypothetical protein